MCDGAADFRIDMYNHVIEAFDTEQSESEEEVYVPPLQLQRHGLRPCDIDSSEDEEPAPEKRQRR